MKLHNNNNNVERIIRVQYTTTDMDTKQNKREMCHRPLTAAAATMVSLLLLLLLSYTHYY